eukprot:1146449-Pelagomonas_calceolata.AAC.2
MRFARNACAPCCHLSLSIVQNPILTFLTHALNPKQIRKHNCKSVAETWRPTLIQPQFCLTNEKRALLRPNRGAAPSFPGCRLRQIPRARQAHSSSLPATAGSSAT